jgi:Bacteriophage baseplate protein W
VSIDLVGTGWHFPLRTGPSGRFATAGGTDKLEQAMRLILTTYPGERPARPDFGSRLRDFVFRPITIDTIADVSFEVREALWRWEPRVVVEDVDTNPDPGHGGLLHIAIGYTVRATNDRRNLVFPFYTNPDGIQE